jgi:hypothetical protein
MDERQRANQDAWRVLRVNPATDQAGNDQDGEDRDTPDPRDGLNDGQCHTPAHKR